MNELKLRYTLRINQILFAKFHYIAAYHGRSANKEIEQYMKQCAQSFERQHGKIDLEDAV